MNTVPQAQRVPHSIGINRPAHALPQDACDSHMHILDPRFAPSPHWKRQPPHADVTAYRRLQQRLGTTRMVVVNPSTYGTDNACTLDALAQLGERARGVAVVDHEVADSELDALAAQRVCGLRVNFVTPQSWGATTPQMLTTLARKVVRLGWHIQVFVQPEQLVALAPVLARIPVPLVIDHMARIDPAEGTKGEAYATARRLLDGGNTWMKLSGVYMRSRDGAPAYGDVSDLGRALVAAAPERLVWGSDWPHTTEAPDTVNDADLADVLAAWCGSTAVRDRILVDNPAKLYGFAAA
ncbi:amidohydrolase family protein [Variovorax boronicumulans]|uniref:amidohydrolase family protein n=1 Tax=Variovorax boronicumulans TaxID=436515 RepID=UPI002793F174|nr:amidohydrolase family protein [Variovorax boronicumulans]MDP9877336.1 putative TIM-barrel fold metal-dependent hydrolase [Variovorax boronicumulans]